MKRAYLIVFLQIIQILKVSAQADVEFIFKQFLFLENNSIQGSTNRDSLFSSYSKLISLKIDTINTNYFGIKSQFYSLKLYDKENNTFIKNVIHKRSLSLDETKYYTIPVNKYIGHYVVAIIPKTGVVYRLAGFSVNDFWGYLNDFKEQYKALTKKRLSDKKFLKVFQVNELDFNCLFKGLDDSDFSRKIYPCFMRCSDPISIE